MNYSIEIYDRAGLRVTRVEETPLLEVRLGSPGAGESVRGLLPTRIQRLEPGYTVRVAIKGRPIAQATLSAVRSQWGDTRKLILERYIAFHEVLEIEAEGPVENLNKAVLNVYRQDNIGAIVKDLLQRTPGNIHSTVPHNSYPDGSVREYEKFIARTHPENALAVGSITEGQWVDSTRIDLTDAYAKDGDTIAGLKVDGESWPDLRMMLLDAEESALNSHAIARHPEAAAWTTDQYNASGYKRRADDATDFLQALIDSNGIDYIELNPHRNSAGAFDDRVDAYGRYLGLVYGGGLCYNAALVETGHADVYLYDEGRYLAPELELKDFFSYTAVNTGSIGAVSERLDEFQAQGRIYELLAGLAYAADGFVFDVNSTGRVRFRSSDAVDHVIFYDPVAHAVELAPHTDALVNYLTVEGHPFMGSVRKSYARSESIDAYGFKSRLLPYFALSSESDVDRLAGGLLADVAYPEFTGALTFFRGNHEVCVGDVIELRGAPLREIAPRLPGQWQGRFPDRIVARVREITHRLTGKRVETTVALTSLLRSVDNPLAYLIRSQESAARLFEFRLDSSAAGLDSGFHLD